MFSEFVGGEVTRRKYFEKPSIGNPMLTIEKHEPLKRFYDSQKREGNDTIPR